MRQQSGYPGSDAEVTTVNHLFAELIRRQDALTETDPCERVLAGALVYCEFGLAAPGHYQLHGIVSLSISRSNFPWPPLEPTVRAAVAGLLATSKTINNERGDVARPTPRASWS